MHSISTSDHNNDLEDLPEVVIAVLLCGELGKALSDHLTTDKLVGECSYFFTLDCATAEIAPLLSSTSHAKTDTPTYVGILFAVGENKHSVEINHAVKTLATKYDINENAIFKLITETSPSQPTSENQQSMGLTHLLNADLSIGDIADKTVRFYKAIYFTYFQEYGFITTDYADLVTITSLGKNIEFDRIEYDGDLSLLEQNLSNCINSQTKGASIVLVGGLDISFGIFMPILERAEPFFSEDSTVVITIVVEPNESDRTWVEVMQIK